MQLQGVRGQFALDHLYDASGEMLEGGEGSVSQLLLPEHKARSYLLIINTSPTPLYVDFGGSRATATISGGVVTSIAVNNAGQGYTLPPLIKLVGGGPPERNQMAGLGAGTPTWPSPSNQALASAVMTGSAPNQSISSIAVGNGGAGYLRAPYVLIENAPGDAHGVAIASATSIPLLTTGSTLTFEGSNCPTDAVSIYGATVGQTFVCKYMY